MSGGKIKINGEASEIHMGAQCPGASSPHGRGKLARPCRAMHLSQGWSRQISGEEGVLFHDHNLNSLGFSDSVKPLRG